MENRDDDEDRNGNGDPMLNFSVHEATRRHSAIYPK